MPLGTVLFGTNESNGTVQGSECAAFRDPDRREGRAEGHAQVARKRRMDDAMKFEKLCRENAKQYIEYLKAAMEKEPEMMTAEVLDEEGILKRLEDPFYGRTTSVLAMDGECVVGRIEYHFYGCMQDGARMAYVDWVYVLPEWRRKGVAQQLFARFEEDCVAHEIDQYYLIRATNPAADRFYHHFENAELSETPLLRKMCQKEPSQVTQEGELR